MGISYSCDGCGKEAPEPLDGIEFATVSVSLQCNPDNREICPGSQSRSWHACKKCRGKLSNSIFRDTWFKDWLEKVA
jgi:hypothetical protein